MAIRMRSGPSSSSGAALWNLQTGRTAALTPRLEFGYLAASLAAKVAASALACSIATPGCRRVTA